ncbi:hypothetical protein RchiOBHm_Chr3g0479831 [Rosa chinensis]|uniref:Uncharacterized protein n=1 Tax=Rosa chinensis TaxID=74649 RepID=A0A2P6RDG6_ROSCH|nr:hypothetical protein RchiOBHm_Chr3g0479831 [Rosa chinensis]
MANPVQQMASYLNQEMVNMRCVCMYIHPPRTEYTVKHILMKKIRRSLLQLDQRPTMKRSLEE